MWLYNLSMSICLLLARILSPFTPKLRAMLVGRKGMFDKMQREIDPAERKVWIHVASLGDFEQGRPLVDYVHDHYPDYKIVLTFFSPSGYNVRKNYPKADYVYYIPIDIKRNTRKFLDIVQPEIAIFVKYEFWLNMLAELRKREIRTFIASAIFRRNSIFFKPYGWWWRDALHSFESIFVQDENSKTLLAELGVENVVVAGDTRFDRVIAIADKAEKVAEVEQFKGDARLFVAGSTWGDDEEILLPLINSNPDIKFVIAPHEMDESRIERLLREVKGGAVRYTQLSGVNLADNQVLVLDTIGLLSRVYGSAEWAYIGGGFGVGIHNTLEAVVYGVPVAFGPNYGKFKEAHDLIALGVGRSVKDVNDLTAWFDELKSDSDYLARLSALAKVYVGQHRGTTEKIVNEIFSK
jgi:3-deoxy-D-manno-octulosonic-acid transferase